jgi:hypothetical protein
MQRNVKVKHLCWGRRVICMYCQKMATLAFNRVQSCEKHRMSSGRFWRGTSYPLYYQPQCPSSTVVSGLVQSSANYLTICYSSSSSLFLFLSLSLSFSLSFSLSLSTSMQQRRRRPLGKKGRGAAGSTYTSSSDLLALVGCFLGKF